jgi:uncharacterized protein YbaR (Trm112 family)
MATRSGWGRDRFRAHPAREDEEKRGDAVLIDRELLEILACPLCKTEVRLEGDRIVCTQCGRRYPVRDDIPVMLVEEAELPPDKPAGGAPPGGA